MSSKKKGYFFVVFLFLCVAPYTLLPEFPELFAVFQNFNIFQQDQYNFIFMMVLFILFAYVLTELSAYIFRLIAKSIWRAPKIGKILVSQGYITRDELCQALEEQRLKIGEVLVQEGCITPQQLAVALKYEHKKARRMGEILIELGYTTEADIRRALRKMNRKLGNILCDKNLVSKYDITCALSLRKYRVNDHGRITVWP